MVKVEGFDPIDNLVETGDILVTEFGSVYMAVQYDGGAHKLIGLDTGNRKTDKGIFKDRDSLAKVEELNDIKVAKLIKRNRFNMTISRKG